MIRSTIGSAIRATDRAYMQKAATVDRPVHGVGYSALMMLIDNLVKLGAVDVGADGEGDADAAFAGDAGGVAHVDALE